MTSEEMKQLEQKIEEEDFDYSNEVVSRTVTEFCMRMQRINKHRMDVKNGDDMEAMIALWKNTQYYLNKVIQMGVDDGYIVLDELKWYPSFEDCIEALAKEEE